MILALPTARGVLLTLLAAGSSAVAVVNVGLATALVAAALGGVVLASFLLAQCSLYRIRVERRPNRDGHCGAEISLPLFVTNRSWFFRQPLVISERCPFAPDGILHSVVPPLAPREAVEVPRHLIALCRGHFQLKKLRLAGGDPAGLFRRTRTLRLPGEIMIYPKTVKLSGANLQFSRSRIPSHDGRPLGHSGQGQEFFGLRPYRPGDEIRFIHWKGTAAKRKLMIREFEANTIDRITILLDTFQPAIGRDERENNLEFLVAAAASLSEYLGDMYCHIHFFAADGDNTELVHLSGDASGVRQRLTQALMRLKPSRSPFPATISEALETIAPGSVIYALSMSAEPETLQLLELLLDQDSEVRWIWAPALNFPIVAPDAPRILYPGLLPAVNESSPVRPLVAAYHSQLPELLKN